tara:strand:+ start:333 stop:851 length:519 start_codon:yes stop_codon:yes gene_type:complete
MRKAIILPILCPLVLILSTSFLNQNKNTSIKLLLWETPVSKVGYYIGLSGTLGFTVSALYIYIIVSTGNIRFHKKTKIKLSNKNLNHDDVNQNNIQDKSEIENSYYQRDIRDPSPTVEVRYTIKKSKFDNIEDQYAVGKEEDKEEVFGDSTQRFKNQNNKLEEWSNEIYDDW